MKFLITVKEEFTRDIQIAPDNYVKDYMAEKDTDSSGSDWLDFGGELIIGTFDEESEKDAIIKASKSSQISKDALKSYILK